MSKHSSSRRPAVSSRQRWLWIGAALLALLAVAAVVYSQGGPRAGALPPLSAARLASDPTLGPAGAPLTLVEYGDFG